MTTNCTDLEENAINVLKQLNKNVFLLCNRLYVTNNQKDAIITTKHANESTQKIQTIEEGIKELLKEATIEIKSEKQQKQVAPEAKKPTPKNGKASQKKYDGIRIRGIPESEATDARSRADEDMQKVIPLLDVMDFKCPISDLRRLGKYAENKNRPLVLRVSAPWVKRRILLPLYKLKSYEHKVFISKELTPDEREIENNMLKTRRDLIQSGKFESTQLRLRNLKLIRKLKRLDRGKTR